RGSAFRARLWPLSLPVTPTPPQTRSPSGQLRAAARGGGPVARGLVGEDDDPCVEGLCPGEPQGCLADLPEQQRSAADEDGVDHEVELVEELVLQQRLP